MQIPSLGQEDPLKKGLATLSSTLAWRIPWTEKPRRLWSIRQQSWTWLKQLSTQPREAKIPRAVKKPKQKPYCTTFNKDSKNGPYKKFFLIKYLFLDSPIRHFYSRELLKGFFSLQNSKDEVFFFFFFNFTILYWFCHISKWICWIITTEV